MDIKQLLEKIDQFAGQAVGQKPGDQWRGTDKAPPGKKLVGDSILKDLSKGKTPKSKEQELSEEFQAFLEAEFQDTVDRRPARKNSRPARGHTPQSGYKTVKAEEGAMSEKDIELQDYRSMSHKEFQAAYGMTKTEWINQNKALVIKNPSIKKALGLEEGWESGPEEYKEPYDDADDAYDRMRQDKIDTEAEKEWAKLPKVSTYKLVGRGPNMEPNYEFGDEFDSMEQALEYRAKIMKDPKTPHPEHIGIRTITRVVKENSVTTPQNPEHAKQMMKDLGKLQTEIPNPDPELQATMSRRKDILMKQAKELGIDESRAHKVLDTWFKNRELAQKYASGEVKIPTPQERKAELEKSKEKKQVKELVATPPQGTATQTMQQKTQAQDPKQAQAVAQATQAMKSATGSSAPATTLAKALDTASQGKPVQGQEAAALQPLMKDMATVAQDPKLSGSFKSLVNQINQAQIRQK